MAAAHDRQGQAWRIFICEALGFFVHLQVANDGNFLTKNFA